MPIHVVDQSQLLSIIARNDIIDNVSWYVLLRIELLAVTTEARRSLLSVPPNRSAETVQISEDML
jgi:hypothetical protein